MPQVDQNIKEKMLFIKKFVAEPRMIGSITPSSPQLVASMLCNVDWDKIGCIAEFGAGEVGGCTIGSVSVLFFQIKCNVFEQWTSYGVR